MVHRSLQHALHSAQERKESVEPVPPGVISQGSLATVGSYLVSLPGPDGKELELVYQLMLILKGYHFFAFIKE